MADNLPITDLADINEPAASESLSRTASGAADWLGIVASIACAIHCAAMPFVIAFLPALGLSFLADAVFHKVMVFVCSAFAITSFVPGFRRHGRKLPIAIASAGLLLISVAAFVVEGDCCPSCSVAVEEVSLGLDPPALAGDIAISEVETESCCDAGCCESGACETDEDDNATLVSSTGKSEVESERCCEEGCCETNEDDNATLVRSTAKGDEGNSELASSERSTDDTCTEPGCTACCGSDSETEETLKLASDEADGCTDSGCTACGGADSTSEENLEDRESGFPFIAWITPLGGLLLVSAHLTNRRFNGTCGCCSTSEEA